MPVMVYLHGGRLDFTSSYEEVKNDGLLWKNFAASTNQVRDSRGRIRPHHPRSSCALRQSVGSAGRW